MRPASRPLHLYAAVPAGEASALGAKTRGFSILTCGPVAAVFGRPPLHDSRVRAALRHSRIVGLAFETCSSVVPFRLGVELESAAELRAVLSLNARELSLELARFRGRVEMGLKVRLAAATAGEPFRLPFSLDRVRQLAPEPADHCERFGRSVQGRIFEGCYLISRQAVESFWRALEGIRRRAPELLLLGSGPWAAYSFCDAPLRHGGEPARSVLEGK